MNEELINHQLEVNERRLNNHAERIDKLEQNERELQIEIKNLCKNIQSLTSVMKWFVTALIGAFISFFFYAVQYKIFQ